MLVAYDKNDNISILDSTGKSLYKTGKNTEIILSGLPIIHKNNDYLVLHDTGEVLINGKDKILSSNMIDNNCIAVCFEKSLKNI
ncbi:MAG: hypothetical protein V8R64_17095 [Thomasclavelia sp.]